MCEMKCFMKHIFFKFFTCHRRCVKRPRPVIVSPLHFSGRDPVPPEVEFPVEPSPSHVRGGHVLKAVIKTRVVTNAVLSLRSGALSAFQKKILICWCDTELTNHPGKKRQGGKTIKNSVSEHTPVVWNDVNDWTDDSLSILRDLCQEGLQPTLSAFAVSVKECYHLSLGFFGPKQSERGFMLWHK